MAKLIVQSTDGIEFVLGATFMTGRKRDTRGLTRADLNTVLRNLQPDSVILTYNQRHAISRRVVLTPKKLSIGCQNFRGTNRTTLKNWALYS